MSENGWSSSCEDFQAQLSDLIGSGQGIALHPHLLTCANCHALLTDLQTIADVAKELLPIVQPREGLWDRIDLAMRKQNGAA